MLSPDEQLSFLAHNLNFLFNRFVPVKYVKIKPRQQPWFSEEIRKLIEQRQIAYNHWKRYKTPLLLDKYKALIKDVKKKIKQAKISYYENNFNTAIDSKQKWSTIKNLGVGKNKACNLDPTDLDLNELNKRFVNLLYQMNTVDLPTVRI